MATHSKYKIKFCLQWSIYNKSYKGESLPFTKKTSKDKNCISFEKTALDVLVFHHAFQIGCVCIQLWFKQTYTLTTVFLIIQHTLALFMKCSTVIQVNWWFIWLFIELRLSDPTALAIAILLSFEIL